MDHDYAIQALTSFLKDIKPLLADMEFAAKNRDVAWPDWPHDAAVTLAEVRPIIETYAPNALSGQSKYPAEGIGYWQLARLAATEALGRARFTKDNPTFQDLPSPSLDAEALHPWVWAPAAPLWAVEAHQDAVLAAARVINRRLQKKLNRHDIGDKNLCMQSFSIKEPTAEQPRLRFSGDRDSPTWTARQEGAMHLSAGAFLGIRNLAAHEEKVTWTQQEALEYLSTFSVVARWIEECEVETAA
ncbi:TIGR02391 family protein [Streptomyces lavendulocolor]|uniref:TIGR02391 family protein n=1 Tax=Streptomyces lavendulocolor TaxID=67316 RepID=UPI003C30DA71